MARVTSKLQVTLPKVIADRYKIRPGDQIVWEPAGEVIRVIPAQAKELPDDRELRLRLFDRATERQRKRATVPKRARSANRGWTREDLYSRGRAH